MWWKRRGNGQLVVLGRGASCGGGEEDVCVRGGACGQEDGRYGEVRSCRCVILAWRFGLIRACAVRLAQTAWLW